MADYSNSKRIPTNTYPVESQETTNLLGRAEPTIGPDLLISRYLKGQEKEIREKYSNEELKDQINLAMNDFESISGLNIYPVQYRERLPFDRDLWRSFVFTNLKHRPVLSIEEFNIMSADQEKIYQIPPSWIEIGMAYTGKIYLIPIIALMGATSVSAGTPASAGLVFLNAISFLQWLPSFFSVIYTSGISKVEGEVPNIINQVIGMTSAIAILSELQSSNRHTSSSIGQDGLSQSSSSPGPQVYKTRIEDLTAKRDKLMARVRAIFHNRYFLSNI